MENEELREFEMLEEAANMSFSSELSLFNDLPKHLPFRQPVTKSTGTSGMLPPERSETVVSKPTVIPDQGGLTTYHPELVKENENEHNASVDLDETLKFSPSLAKGVEFNDEEAWESFSHGSPQSRHRTESSGSDVTLSHLSPLSQSGVWRSPVKKEVLGRTAGFTAICELDKNPDEGAEYDLGRGFKGTNSGSRVAAVERYKVVESPGMAGGSISAYTHTHVREQTDYHTAGNPRSHVSEPGDSGNSSSRSSGIEQPVQSSLPPPSALVSKLFPVLRRVEEQPNTKPGNAPLVKTPSPISSTEGDSGIRSLSSTSVALSEDLKYKLTQLEEEIARYRSENASLEILRKEREDVSRMQISEVVDFTVCFDIGCSSFAARNSRIQEAEKRRNITF